MYLEELFSDKAQHETGPFITTIEFVDDLNELNETKEEFRYLARQAAYELNIVVGVTETSRGFRLGFEQQDDYPAFLEIIEPKLLANAELRQKRDARYKEWAEELFAEHVEQRYD